MKKKRKGRRLGGDELRMRMRMRKRKRMSERLRDARTVRQEEDNGRVCTDAVKKNDKRTKKGLQCRHATGSDWQGSLTSPEKKKVSQPCSWV